MEYVEFTGKTVDDAITEACQKFTVTSDRLEYDIIERGTAGIFGFAAKPAVIKARVYDPNAPKEEVAQTVQTTEEASEGHGKGAAPPGRLAFGNNRSRRRDGKNIQNDGRRGRQFILR